MAVTETRQLVNPTLEGSLTAFLKKVDPLGGTAINTAAYAPQVAAQSALQIRFYLLLLGHHLLSLLIP